MSLAGLPTEILQKVIEWTTPEGLKAPVLTCRRAHNAAAADIDAYNVRRKEFRHFQFSVMEENGAGPWDERSLSAGFIVPDVGELLCRLAEEPSLCRYIHEANFRAVPPTPIKYDQMDKDT